MKRSLFKERLTKEKKKKCCYSIEHDYNQDISVLAFLPFFHFLTFLLSLWLIFNIIFFN